MAVAEQQEVLKQRVVAARTSSDGARGQLELPVAAAVADVEQPAFDAWRTLEHLSFGSAVVACTHLEAVAVVVQLELTWLAVAEAAELA